VKNIHKAIARYRAKDIPTIEKIAEELGTTYHNVSHVLKVNMPTHERRTLAKLRYSASKSGDKNPMKGKTREKHHNWIGECEDDDGYLTVIHNGKRRFVHRVVMAEALGLDVLPRSLAVHHIDGDKKNNDLDNLALVTHAGHNAIHYLQGEDSLLLKSRKSTIADALKYMT